MGLEADHVEVVIPPWERRRERERRRMTAMLRNIAAGGLSSVDLATYAHAVDPERASSNSPNTLPLLRRSTASSQQASRDTHANSRSPDTRYVCVRMWPEAPQRAPTSGQPHMARLREQYRPVSPRLLPNSRRERIADPKNAPIFLETAARSVSRGSRPTARARTLTTRRLWT